jgi:hypothetical protein
MHAMRRVTAATILLFHVGAGAAGAAPLTELERQRLLSHLEVTAGWLIDEVSALSPEQLSFRPAPGTWTILEVLDHINLTGNIYWQDLQAAMKTPGGRKSMMTDTDILWYGIDRTNRERAIPSEIPKGPKDIKAGLDAYRKHHLRLVEYIRTTQDDLRGHYVERQRCDAYQWALLISTHEQRHVLQIREIKAGPKFPAK